MKYRKSNISEDMIVKRGIKDDEKRLKNARVCILGAGGLGSNIAVSLARSGVGHLKIVDFDIVEPSNLNRQYYFLSHIGKKKVDCLKELISKINPYVDINIQDVRVDESNILEIVKDYDIICEAFDRAEIKSMAISEILSNCKDKVIVSGSGMAGIGNSNDIKTHKKFKNLFICGDYMSDFEEVNGIMSPRVNICAGHQANIILRIVMGIEII